MNVEELIAIINTESMQYFIPLRDIPNETVRKEYQERLKDQFYQFPYHYQSFQEAYPNLNSDWVYCNRGISSLYYWEEDAGILLKNPVELEGLKIGNESGSRSIEDMVLKELAHCREEVQKQDYRFIFRTLNGTMKMEYLNWLLDEQKPVKNLFTLFHACYVGTDFGASVISHENLKRVMEAMTEDEQKVLQEQKQKLSDVVTIYRGEGARSTPYEKAYSCSPYRL